LKEPGFYDLIVRNAPLQDVIRVVAPERYAVPDEATSIQGQLLVIPSNIESRSIASNISDAFVVFKRFQRIREVVDFIIFDTSPTPSLLHSSIYMATDAIIYPTKCEAWSFDGIRESMAHKNEFDPFRQKYSLAPIVILGIVPTMFLGKTVEQSENFKMLKRAFGDLVWSPIGQRTIWTEAAGSKRSVFSIAPDSKAAAEAWRMVRRVEEANVISS
jgi:cellulose biosynthesis protein BcsQ